MEWTDVLNAFWLADQEQDSGDKYDPVTLTRLQELQVKWGGAMQEDYAGSQRRHIILVSLVCWATVNLSLGELSLLDEVQSFIAEGWVFVCWESDFGW